MLFKFTQNRPAVSILLFAIALVGSTANAQITVLDPPALVSPPNGTILQNPNEEFEIPLQWAPVAEAEYYQVSYTLRVGSQIFPYPPQNTTETTLNITINPADTEEVIIVSWSVRSFADGISPSLPPTPFSFTIGTTGTPLPDFLPTPTPLPVPQLIHPENGALIDARQPVSFQWSPQEDASSYEYQIYLDNQVRIPGSSFVSEVNLTLDGIPFVQKVYQWRVRAIDDEGRTGYWSNRNWFQVNKIGFTLPTPTPAALSLDLNSDGEINAADLFIFATRYQTNAPSVDFNHNGRNDTGDLLFFIRFLPQTEPPLMTGSAMLKIE